MPVRQLRGFARVTLAPDESTRVTFRLRAVDDFGYYDEARNAFAVDPGDYEVAVGGSSANLPGTARIRVQ